MFRSLKVAQAALDEWVAFYNTARTHQSLGDVTPASRFRPAARALVPERNGEQWVTRSVARNGVVCVGWQQVSVGKNYSGSACDVLVTDKVLQFWVANELIKTVARTSTGEIRKKRAGGTAKSTHMGSNWDTSTGVAV